MSEDIPNFSIPILLFRLLLLAAFAYIAWRAFQPAHVFRIRIKSTGLKMQKGVVARQFLLELDSIRHDFKLDGAWVAGIRNGKAMRLVFSKNIPDDARQRVRNLWMVYK